MNRGDIYVLAQNGGHHPCVIDSLTVDGVLVKVWPSFPSSPWDEVETIEVSKGALIPVGLAPRTPKVDNGARALRGVLDQIPPAPDPVAPQPTVYRWAQSDGDVLLVTEVRRTDKRVLVTYEVDGETKESWADPAKLEVVEVEDEEKE